MKLKMILTGGLLLSGVLFSTVQVNAQDVSKLSPKEYKAELARWQSRETSAGSESSRLGRDIESLIKQIADIDKTIALERQAIFGLRASSDEEIREYMDMLKELELDVANLNNLSEEELMGDAELLEDMELRLEKLSENDLAALEQNRNLLSDIDKMLSNYRTVIPEPTQDDESLAEVKTDGEVPKVVQFDRKADSYRVIRGDSLWKISGKEIIYNDPFQWLKIYSANRDQISNPDLIEIDQVFVIPRTPASNEHWVSRGESLSKIAAMRYSNPFEWTRIYQANKTILESPDLIHPHTILIIPKKN
ncbi:MAG: LysM peptidoglycan-binding domain-containing protein [Candidatus Marinimicrobia bacterium]|nr:LysM peptidoglycan-binding domain-containing protein [Candidatus Neomarinimicrobiota bacterium]